MENNNTCNPEAANQQNQQNNCCCEKKKKTWKGTLVTFLGGVIVGAGCAFGYQNRDKIDKVKGYFQKKSQKGGEQG